MKNTLLQFFFLLIFLYSFNTFLSAQNAGNDQEICVNSTVLNADPGPGEWSLFSGSAVIANPTLFNTEVYDLTQGVTIFEWTVDGLGSDYVTVTNNSVTSNAGSDYSHCVYMTNLNALNPTFGSGIWAVIGIPGPIISNPTLYNSWVTDLNEGQNIFRWTVTLGNCSDFDDVSITNNGVTATADNISTCNNTVQLNGNNPSLFNIPGTGVWSMAGGQGTIVTPTLYNSSVTGLVTGATSSYIWTVTNGICVDNIVINVHNNNFNLSAGSDVALCSDSYTLTGDPVPVGGSGTWTVITGSGTFANATIHNTFVSGLANGWNGFEWTVHAAGCVNSDIVYITNNNPSPAEIMNPVSGIGETCDGTYTVQGNNPVYGSGQWSISSGQGWIADPTNYQTFFTGLGTFSNVFNWTITNGGCSSTASVTIFNNQVSADAGMSQSVCVDYTNLNAAAPLIGSGVWTNVGLPGPVIDDPTLNSTLVSNLNDGLNTFRWTVTEGICSDIRDVQITSNAVTANATNISTCNTSVILTGNDPSLFTIPGTGVWYVFSGIGTITTPTLFNSGLTGLVTGATSSYQWTVTNGICADAITIQVHNNNFILSAGTDVTQCGDSYTLAADAVPAGGAGNWTVISGSGIFANPTIHNTLVSGLTNGVNTFSWTVTNAEGCTNNDHVNITNNNPTLAEIMIPVSGIGETCDGTYAIQGNNPVYGSGQWTQHSGGGWIADPTNFQTLVTGLGSGPSVFVWTITNGGCSSTASVTILNNQVSADAGMSQSVCVDYTNLNATAPEIGSGIWTNVGFPGPVIENSLSANSLVSQLSPGLNTFRWTVNQGKCYSYSDVQINNASVFATASDQSAQSSSFFLDGNDPSLTGATGFWEIIEGSGNILNTTLYNSEINSIPNGTKTILRWNVSNGLCSDSKIINLTNLGVEIYAGPNQLICAKETTMAGDPGPGIWELLSGSAVIETPTLFNTQISNIGPGINVFRWMLLGVGAGEVSVTNNFQEAHVTIPGSGYGETNNSIFILEGNKPLYGTGFWVVAAGSGIITDITNFQTQVHCLAEGSNVLSWTIFKNGCSSTDSVTIVNNQIVADAGPSQFVCTNHTTLQASIPPFGVGFWANVGIPGSVILSSTTNITEVTNLNDGVNIFRWTVNYSYCSFISDVEINNNSVTALADHISTCNTTVQLNGNDPGLFNIPGTGLWSMFGGQGTIVTPTLYNSNVTGLVTGATSSYLWTVTNGICSDDIVINVHNNNFNLSAGSDVANCSDSYTLAGDPLPAEGSGNWSVISGSGTIVNPTIHNTLLTGLGNGINTFVWTVTNAEGCTNSDHVNITNNNPTPAEITIPISGIGETCDGTYTVQGNNPVYGNGLWTMAGGAGWIVDPTNYQTMVTGLYPGQNIFEWMISNSGCTSTASVTIFNNQVSADAGMNQMVCVEYANLNAAAPLIGSGVWTNVGIPGPIISDLTLNTTLVSNLSPDLNTFRWTVTQGSCSDFSDIEIINNSVSASASNQSGTSSSFILDGNNPQIIGASGLWEIISGSGLISDPTYYASEIINIQINSTTQLKWTVSKDICNSSIEISITNTGYDVNAGPDQEVCVNETTLFAEPSPGFWEVLSGSGYIQNATLYNSSVTNLSKGANIFRWTIEGYGSDEVIVLNNEVSAYAGKDTVIYWLTYPVPSAQVTLNADSVDYPATGMWSTLSPFAWFDDPTLPEATVYDLIAGNNRLTWTVTNGICSASDDVRVFSSNQIENNGNGPWNNPNTWIPSVVPSQWDSVIVRNGNVDITGYEGNCRRLLLGSNGLLNIQEDAFLNAGLLSSCEIIVEQEVEKGAKGTANLNLNSGGSVHIEQEIETDLIGKGIVIGSGGVVTVGQVLKNEKYNQTNLVVSGGKSIYVKATHPEYLNPDANLSIFDGGNVIVENELLTGYDHGLYVGSAGTVTLDQKYGKEKLLTGIIIRDGGNIVLDPVTDSNKSLNPAGFLIKGGAVTIEQAIGKDGILGSFSINNGALFQVEPNISGIGAFIQCPAILINNASMLVGSSSKLKGNSTVTTGMLIAHHETIKGKLLSNPNLVIENGGEIHFINSPYINQPAYIQLLNNASFTIKSGGSITVENNAIPTLYMESGASFIDSTGINCLPGMIMIDQLLNPGIKLISSPVSDFFNSSFHNSVLSDWKESTFEWTEFAEYQALINSIGYKSMTNGFDTVRYNGNSMNQSQNIELSNNLSNQDLNTRGWNVVGNPFTSAIDWEQIQLNDIENVFYAFNETEQNFEVYQKGGISLNNADPFISVAEGVYVKTYPDVSSAILNFGSVSKVHEIPGLYPVYDTKSLTDGLLLQVSDEIYSDQTIIGFRDGSSSLFESNLDAVKLFSLNQAVPQLYTVSDDSVNTCIMISHFPENNVPYVIPLNFHSSYPGDFTLNAQILNPFPEYPIFLKDLKNDSIVDIISEPSYLFDYDNGETDQRFELIFGISTDIKETAENNGISIYSFGNEIFIDLNGDFKYGNIRVFSMQGKLVKQHKVTAEGLYKLEIPDSDGIYVVKVETEKYGEIKKVYISN